MLAQRRFELVSDAWQRIPEDGVDEKEARAYLVGHRGPDGARPLREPERGDLAAELSRLPLALAREQIRIVETSAAICVAVTPRALSWAIVSLSDSSSGSGSRARSRSRRTRMRCPSS